MQRRLGLLDARGILLTNRGMAMDVHSLVLIMVIAIKAHAFTPSSLHLGCLGSLALALEVGPSSLGSPHGKHISSEHYVIWRNLFGLGH